MNIINLIGAKTRNKKPPVSTDSFSINDAEHEPTAAQTRYAAPKALYGEKSGFFSLFKDCIQTLFRKPPRLTALILAFCLTIPASIAMMSTSFISAEQNLLDNRHITVFLSKQSGSQASLLATTLADNKHIIAAELRPVDLQNREVMAMDVQPAATLDSRQLAFIIDELNSHTLVDYIAADTAWLARNVEAIETARNLRIISFVTAALITAVIGFLLTRSDLPRQNRDLSALHQMGASWKMLEKPLMLRSLVLALVAGIAGSLLAWGAIKSLPILVDLSTYEQILPRSFPAVSMASLIILAIICSFLTVRMFVKLR